MPVKFTSRECSGLPDLYEASITQLQLGMTAGHFTSFDLVKAYIARIEEVNHIGPQLHAVIEINPNALIQATALDLERTTKGSLNLGALHGIPIMVKDSIGTMHEEGMNTTAGSFALLGSKVKRDATVVAHLRRAGAIILGKTNLSEWGNWRGKVSGGFSGRGGQTTSPYYPQASARGSSSGSGVATAIGLVAGTLAVETNGSIALPSSRNNVVGVKPTVGLTSRAGVIGISTHMDSVGPICRSVQDAALLLRVIAGRDPWDEATTRQPETVPNYLEALDPNALKGACFGIPRVFQDNDKNVITQFNNALQTIQNLGGIIVDPAEFPATQKLLKVQNSKVALLNTDFKIGLNKYLTELSDVPTGVRSLADLIKFNVDHADKELIPPHYIDQSQLIASEATQINDTYNVALAELQDLGRSGGIDGLLEKYSLDAILIPTNLMSSMIASLAGYPIVTVPLGFMPDDIMATPANPIILEAPGLPFGISIIGTAFSEFKLLSYAYAYEQATQTRLKRRAFPEAIPKTQLKNVVKKCRISTRL